MALRPVITADEMDRMSPEERAAAVRAGTILSLDELPENFRNRIIERARVLNEQFRSHEEP